MSYGDPKWREWVLDEEHSRPFFKRSLELGINFFDTADMYSLGVSEEVTGNILKDLAKREDIVIASKVFNLSRRDTNSLSVNSKGLSRKHIMESVKASLKRLQTDYIDLYQIHRWDSETPIEETMEALHDVVKSGMVHYIGASSMYAWQLAKAQHIAKERGFTQFVTMQNHYNLIYREEEREMNPFCVSEGVGLLPWSPLARGYLTGSRKRGDDLKVEADTLRSRSDPFAQLWYGKKNTYNNDFDIIERLVSFAQKEGCNTSSNCTCLDITQTWCHSTNYWSNQDESSGRCSCCT